LRIVKLFFVALCLVVSPLTSANNFMKVVAVDPAFVTIRALADPVFVTLVHAKRIAGTSISAPCSDLKVIDEATGLMKFANEDAR
jgi:hypothetical protein